LFGGVGCKGADGEERQEKERCEEVCFHGCKCSSSLSTEKGVLYRGGEPPFNGRVFKLKYETPESWAAVALADFDAFLLNHAACERKASSLGMMFVAKYPDRTKLLDPLIEFAREELEHFHQVYRMIEARGLQLSKDETDPYIKQFMDLLRHGRDDRLLDRLVMTAVVEARGLERFSLVAGALPPGEMKDFYTELAKSEARHKGLFIKLARLYFEEEAIQERLRFFLEEEARIVKALPLRPAVH
jgi:tRNA-(ms[2]io[6]A)-hydroxylase